MSEKAYEPLDDLIKEKGWSFTVFAERLGVSYATVYAWRTHPEELTLSKINRIAKATGKSFEEINSLFVELYS